MGLQKVTIASVMDGWSVGDFFSKAGEFLSSIAIDPDMPSEETGNKPSGFLRPTAMAKFSGANVNASPMFITTNPKDNKVYVILNNGRFISFDSSLASETLIATLSTSEGQGMEYYDNAIYLARNLDIARYTPLDGSPAVVTSFWQGTLGLAALVNTTYPSIGGVEMPNHISHRATDDKLYICDVQAGKGVLHYIKTTKTTVEGDTDDGSTLSKLTLGFGLYPTTIETLGDDLAIGVIEGVDTGILQKPAKIMFWDKSSASFNKETSVELKDPLITAMKNVDGFLYVFSGFATGGCRISRFVGGYTLEEVAWIPDILPPLQGAVDHFLNRIMWGSRTSQPEASASVFSFGAKELKFPLGIHNIARATATGANPIVTALKVVQQNSGAKVLPIIAWKDDSGTGIDEKSTTYGNYNVWRSNLFTFANNFSIKEIRIPLAQAIAANMTLKVKIFGDNGSTTPATDDNTLITVNNSGDFRDNRVVKIIPKRGFQTDFFIQLEWEGTALLTVGLPIEILVEVDE